MNSAAIIAKLKAEGWYKVHQAGSHIKFKHLDRLGYVTVAHPKKDIPIGTLKNIYHQAGWK